MVDIYLQELMKGKISTNDKKSSVTVELQDTFEMSLNQQIDDSIRNLDSSEFYSSGPLEPLSVKKEKMRLEMKEETQMLDLASHIEGAIALIYSDEAIDDGYRGARRLKVSHFGSWRSHKKIRFKRNSPFKFKKNPQFK